MGCGHATGIRKSAPERGLRRQPDAAQPDHHVQSGGTDHSRRSRSDAGSDPKRPGREQSDACPWIPGTDGRATIGGIAAANAQGPLRATGTIRDWIIGMTVVHVDGHRSKTGGRVVKNVTGYDLAKLYTGSLGSLAVIAEISFKLRPAIRKNRNGHRGVRDAGGCDRGACAPCERASLQPIALRTGRPEACRLASIRRTSAGRGMQIAQLPPAPWKVFEGADEIAAWERLRDAYRGNGAYCGARCRQADRCSGHNRGLRSIVLDRACDEWNRADGAGRRPER